MKPFEICKKAGGEIRTKTLKGGKYMHICIQDGKSYAGEIKQTKSDGKMSDYAQEAMKAKKMAK